MMSSFKVILGVLFILLLSGVAFLGVVTYKYYQVSVRTAERVSHSYSVIGKTEEVSSSCKDLQLESNAFLVGGDTGFAATYRTARERLISQVDELQYLTAENHAQQPRISLLSRTVGDLVTSTDSVVSVALGGSREAINLEERLMKNTIFRSKIRRVVLDIGDEARQLLIVRKSAYDRTKVAFRNRFFMLAGGIVLLLGTTFISVRYNFNKRAQAERALKGAQSELKSALSKEIELSKMKSNFVTLASHEFRTPLTTILSSTFLLEKYAVGDKGKIDKHLARIRASIVNITSILDDFLSITKIEERKIVPHLERVNIKERLEATCQNFRDLVKPGQTIVHVHTDDEFAVTDPALLSNILTNLVSNAIKFSPENSLISVKSSVRGGLHLSVKDEGIGIPIEDQKHLFDRFYRASNADTVQGTGLGLNIMKHYVDMLQGRIELRSAPGKGTEVEITFDQVK